MTFHRCGSPRVKPKSTPKRKSPNLANFIFARFRDSVSEAR